MDLKKQVEDIIEKRINPALSVDGGSAELVSVDDGVVKLRMKGHCAGCPMRQYTISTFIQRTLKEEIPEVKSVEAVV